MSDVAVVILNYNGKELLKKFLPSILKYSGSAKIIVADNNSSDGSIELITNEFREVELIPISRNLGFCGGYNYALQQVVADYFVLLNSDVEVTPNWLEPIVQALEMDNTIGAAQPKILSYNEKHKFEYAGAAGGFIDSLGYPFCRGRVFHITEEDKGQYDETLPVFWATGACFIVKAELYNKLGGLDETFFAHMEEIDFCWRLNRHGFKVISFGNSKVYHVGGATLDASNPRKTYYNFRNGLILLIKNLSSSELVMTLPIRLLMDTIAAFRFLLTGYGKDFLAVVSAHFYVLFHFFALLKKRQPEVPYKTTLIYDGSIVIDFFLLGKRKFSDLTVNNPK